MYHRAEPVSYMCGPVPFWLCIHRSMILHFSLACFMQGSYHPLGWEMIALDLNQYRCITEAFISYLHYLQYSGRNFMHLCKPFPLVFDHE